MQEIIIELMNQYGYFAILLLIAIENIFPPIPSEVILTVGGFMTLHTNMNLFMVIMMATIGSIIGAIVLYYVGHVFNKERLESFLDGKLGRILRFKKENIEKAIYWFNVKGYYTVFFCRFIPVVRSLISIPAGMSEMRFDFFLLLTLFGSLIWNTVLILLGRVMGDNWEIILEWMNFYSKGIILFISMIAIIGIIYYLNQKKKNK